MKRLILKLVKWGALALVLLVAAAAAFSVWRVRSAWPDVDGEVAAAGLHAPVEIVRDAWGVPHIWAEDEHDLFFAQGYVHAQDRLWQMLWNRLVSGGELASVLGPAVVDADRFLRTLGLRRAAERDAEALTPESRAMLEAYAAGVNHFLETHRNRLPVELSILRFEPRPWTPVDSLAWGKLMSLNLSLNYPMEILRSKLAERVGEEAVAELLPGYPDGAPVIVSAPLSAGERPERSAAVPIPGLVPHPAAGGPAWASNSWVIHGSRTATGRPILANDTHLGLQTPSVWYENGLHGGRLDVVGFSFPGLPLVVIGQNRSAAWGITNMCSDVEDLFVERLDDSDAPTRYRFRGEWRELERRTETIEVAGGEPVALEVLATHHGPLMNAVVEDLADAPPTALAWTGLTTGERLMDALLGLDLAEDWGSFRRALADWDTPSVNFTFAGAGGDVGYQGTGKVPLRPEGDTGLMPRPGWTGEAEWRGFIPYDELPRTLNPPEGYVVTANNRTVGDDYPYHLAHDMADPYRARRIHQVLAAGEAMDLDDVRALQADQLSIPATELAPHLLRLEGLESLTPLEEAALAELRGWDHVMAADSSAAAVYQGWFHFLWTAIFGDELGEELGVEYRVFGIAQVPFLVELMERPDDRWFDDVDTPDAVETRDEILHRALAQAVALLAERHGDDPSAWRWGAMHYADLAHAPLGQSGIAPLEWIFNPARVPYGGDVFTVNEGTPDLRDPFRMFFGVSQRFIADLGDLSRSRAVNSTGQSGHAFHRHRDDQVALWAAVEDHPVLVDRPAVDARAEAVLRLVPAE
ncbi:MAG: penicillin acylase family protein [Acidobacteriota bacterium]